ncbi:hypothetical protein [Chryseobacterium sp. G0201]|uniref:hypothetical protein n=1 Tax=Chryseobacterium sp. G0201 TaxID=2487065 RepID=UPI000F4E77C8|nr:hypothetical protein [Chryseobacterium sp. G0201]AZA53162.1 hypothetical protein EG348_09105 [Chryseobacterium sp. G0201]
MKVYFFILICLLFSCKSYDNYSQQSLCGNNFEIQYNKSSKYVLPKKGKSKNYFIVYLENNFNDRIHITINQKEIFNKLVITNDKKPDEYSDMLIYRMDKNNKYTMNIQGENTKTCVELTLDNKYRAIYLFYYQNKWIIRFSNQMRIN